MISYRLLSLVSAVWLAIGGIASAHAATPEACAAKIAACNESCKQVEGDNAATACVDSCTADAKRCEAGADDAPPAVATPAEPATENPAAAESPASESRVPARSAESPASAQPPAPEQPPTADSPPRAETPPVATDAPVMEKKIDSQVSKSNAALTASAMKNELKKNSQMLVAIRAADFGAIRRLIESKGLSPTYVYSYQPIPQSNLFEARPARLRLSDIFNDTNTFRGESAGQDRILATFIELGLDVKATLATQVSGSAAPVSLTAWGPDFKFMEAAKDREPRLRALELALNSGLTPNDNIGAQLFEELPQICGRDHSKFAIQVFDVLVKYMSPALKDYVRRPRAGGTETIADLLEHSYSQRQPKNDLEKEQFARQDAIWENCSPLSRRINRYLKQGD